MGTNSKPKHTVDSQFIREFPLKQIKRVLESLRLDLFQATHYGFLYSQELHDARQDVHNAIKNIDITLELDKEFWAKYTVPSEVSEDAL